MRWHYNPKDDSYCIYYKNFKIEQSGNGVYRASYQNQGIISTSLNEVKEWVDELCDEYNVEEHGE